MDAEPVAQYDRQTHYNQQNSGADEQTPHVSEYCEIGKPFRGYSSVLSKCRDARPWPNGNLYNPSQLPKR